MHDMTVTQYERHVKTDAKSQMNRQMEKREE